MKAGLSKRSINIKYINSKNLFYKIYKLKAKKMVLILIFFAFFGVIKSEEYSVPDPFVEIFVDKGFRFSIPDEEGVQLFAFHGKINEEMRNLEAGCFSRDITKKCNNEWIFEDRTATLKKGDIINYWLFVQKNRLGYRLDNAQFIVNNTDLSIYKPKDCANNRNIVFPKKTCIPEEENILIDVRHKLSKRSFSASPSSNEFNCKEFYLNAILMENEINQLKFEIEILKEMVQKDATISKS